MTSLTCGIQYMKKWTYLQNRKTHRCREQTCVCQGGETVREGETGSLGLTNANYYSQNR